MEKLDFDELAKVVGGTLTQAAEEWITRNESTIRSRAKAKGLGGLADYALSQVKGCKQEYDVDALKSFLAGYIQVDDLN